MPVKAPRICGCGKVVAADGRCACEAKSNAARKAVYDKARPSSSARGYTGAWDQARKAWLDRHPFCVRCGKRADVVDHKIPHRGDKQLFWDRSNWQSLCFTHHNSSKQREERR